MTKADITPPSREYLEMNFVGETETGRGNNQCFTMENLSNGSFRATESRVGITIGRHRPRSVILPMEQWDNVYQAKAARGYLLTKQKKMEKITIEKSQKKVNGIDYRPLDDKAVNNIIDRLLSFTYAVLSENYTIKVDAISDEMIAYGKNILDEMAKGYAGMSVAEFNNKLKVLYAAVPRRMDKLSKFLAKRKLDFQDIVANEQELFDIMVSQVRCEQKFADMREKPTILEAYGLDWRVVSAAEEAEIKKMLADSSASYVQAWRVENHLTRDRFNRFCEKEGLTEESGISRLFHGSRNENFWSIVTNGLTINPTNVVISGKMFGNGSYFAHLARKSLGYTSRAGSVWTHGTQATGFLAVYQVATGKHYDVTCSNSSLNWNRLQQLCPGAHCTWAHAGIQLRNDEVIVYQDCQSTIQYLVEMSAH